MGCIGFIYPGCLLFHFSAWPRQCEHEKVKDMEKKPLGRQLSFYLKNNSQMNREKENCLQLPWRPSLSPFIVQWQVFPVTLTCYSYSFASILHLNVNLQCRIVPWLHHKLLTNVENVVVFSNYCHWLLTKFNWVHDYRQIHLVNFTKNNFLNSWMKKKNHYNLKQLASLKYL